MPFATPLEAPPEPFVRVKVLATDGFIVSALKLECDVFFFEALLGLPRTEEGQCTARRRPTRRTAYHRRFRAMRHLRHASTMHLRG